MDKKVVLNKGILDKNAQIIRDESNRVVLDKRKIDAARAAALSDTQEGLAQSRKPLIVPKAASPSNTLSGVSSTDAPFSSTHAPYSSTNAPYSSTHAPVSSTNAPYSSTHAPVSNVSLEDISGVLDLATEECTPLSDLPEFSATSKAATKSIVTQRGVGSSDSSVAPPKFDVGIVLKDRYRVERMIGKGGFGLVYEAIDLRDGNKPVAIKTLKHNLDDYEMAKRRFKREIELCQCITDKHAVKIFDDGVAADETLYYVMEYLEGYGLDTLIEKREKFTFRETKAILIQVLSALAEAHEKKIIHRDLKPANIWLTEKTVDNLRAFDVKVLDFGIAKSLDKSAGENKLTQTGTWMGSPAYMSPEQLTGREVTSSSDIFAIGLIAIEMITNRPGVDGDTPMDIAMEIISQNDVYIEDWIAETSFGEILIKCVQKTPSNRYQNARELFEIFETLDDDDLRNEYNEAKMRRKTRTRSSVSSMSSADPILSMHSSMNTEDAIQPVRRNNSNIHLILIGLIAIAMLMVLALVGFVLTQSEDGGDSAPPQDAVSTLSERDRGILKSAAYGSFGAYEQFKGAVSITTTPSTAKVYRASDGVELGTTPINLSLIWAKYNDVNAQPFELVFRAEGYKDLDYFLPINSMTTSHHITLERERRRPNMRNEQLGNPPEDERNQDLSKKIREKEQGKIDEILKAEDEAKKAEAKKQAEEAKKAEAKKAEAQKQAEEAKKAAEAKKAEAKKQADAKKAAEAKKVAEAAEATKKAKAAKKRVEAQKAKEKPSSWSVDGL